MLHLLLEPNWGGWFFTEMQQHNTKMEFQKRKDEVILGLNEQGLNAALFWEVSYYYYYGVPEEKGRGHPRPQRTGTQRCPLLGG